MVFCQECGKELADVADFCSACGKGIKKNIIIKEKEILDINQVEDDSIWIYIWNTIKKVIVTVILMFIILELFILIFK